MILCALAGCASPPPASPFVDVQRDVTDRDGERVYWRTGGAADQQVNAAIAAMLLRPISADDAVQIALLNNRHLQATYEDLGLAQADLVQAGLLRNPVFSFDLRLPDRSPRRAYLDLAVEDDFVDLLMRPARKHLAEGALAAAKARVSDAVLSLAADVRTAFYQYQADRQETVLRQAALAAEGAARTASNQIHVAGNENELTQLQQEAHYEQAQLELDEAVAKEANARERVSDLLGLDDRTSAAWTAAGPLANVPADDLDQQQLESAALGQRADLAAARQEVLNTADAAGIARSTRFLQSLDAGVNGERETDGQWRIGPSLQIPIPLFDQGQAVMARNNALLRQSEQRYLALAVDIRSQVRRDLVALSTARQRATLFHDELLPIQQRLLQQMQLQYNGMYVGVFALLEAKRQQVDAESGYAAALAEYWGARAELERAVGGRLPSDQRQATTPASSNGEQR